MLKTRLWLYQHGTRTTRFFARRANHNAAGQGETTIDRLKNPSRGGQNLSERYARLEKSLRGKIDMQKQIEDIPSALAPESKLVPATASTTFRGFEIPGKPRPPEPDECCMSGCAICVYDLYEDSKAAYNESIVTIRASLTTAQVPESEWPQALQKSSQPDGAKNVALSAFEELERTLKAKHEVQKQT